jgi:hypothetical protein
MLHIDRIVFWICAACFIFWMGLEVGIDEAKDKLATTCLPQPGETLTSTIQGRQGVLTCIYGGGYARVAKQRRAT